MNRRHNGLRLCAVAGVALGLVAAACGSSTKNSSTTSATTAAPPTAPGTVPPSSGPAPGLTASTITLGQIATVSGPVPGLFQGAFNGLDAWAAYVNSNGGIAGRTVKVVQKDDGLDCNTYTNDLTALSSQVFSVVGTFTIEDTCGKALLTSNPTFPDVQAYLLDPHLISLPNALTPTPQPPGYFTTGAIWVKQKFPSAIAHSADVYSTLAKLSYEEISQTYKSQGFKYVYTRGVGPLETNFTSDILRMKSLGVRVVTLETLPVGSIADFIQQADQQGFHPDAIVSAQAYDAALFKTLGSSNANNLYMPLGYPLYLGQDKATNPALVTFLDWLNRTHPGATPDLYTVEAWSAGQLFAQAMKSLGPNPTRSDLINAIQQIHGFTADGLVPARDPGAKQGGVCIVVAGVNGHSFVRLTPPDKGYECNGSYNYIPLSQLGG